MKKIILILFFFFGINTVNAEPTNYINISPQINLNGDIVDFNSSNIYNSTLCENTNNPARIRYYKGNYPDRTGTTETYTSLSNCSTTSLKWFTNMFTSANPLTLKTTNNNTLPNGNYWLDLFSDNNISYYFKFTVQDGIIGINYVNDFNYNGSIGTPTVEGEILECDGITDLGCHLQNVITRTIQAITNSFNFLGNMFQQLWNKEFLYNFFPLNIIFEIQEIFNTEITNTNNDLILEVEVFNTEIDLLNTNTIENWLGSGSTIIKTMLSYSIWIAFFWMLWNSLLGAFNYLTNQKHE